MKAGSPYLKIRKYYRLNQSDWGAALGVSGPAVSQWENGLRAVPGWADAIYSRLQEPISNGDLRAIDRLREQILKAATATRRTGKKRPGKLLAAGAIGVGIGLLLSALFRER